MSLVEQTSMQTNSFLLIQRGVILDIYFIYVYIFLDINKIWDRTASDGWMNDWWIYLCME